ncbi:DoxX family protein [Hydrogenophaga pseudoflava]|uniref:DoxX family protein n=1 Tax=Hydrogenophaga pseudoflava TaxID=47421 RepID=UPI0027E52ADA|nr:DoxX family protein [Hydrogenophaga pseudoflava]MDQ7746732.1 DoxX family protein [Hydrogenophaga pseudoflava]
MNATLLQRGLNLWNTVTDVLDSARPLAALLARAYLAQVFFLSGLTKLRDWDTTLLLFTEEYRVPLLSPGLAAVMGTAGELVLPLMLLLGLAGRFAALGLSVVNAVAVLSLSEIAPAALQQHITWGVLLAALALYGVGRWSVDGLWLQPRLARWLGSPAAQPLRATVNR